MTEDQKLFEVTGTWYSKVIPIVAVVEAEDADEAWALANDGEVQLKVKPCECCNGSGLDPVSTPQSFSIKHIDGSDAEEILKRNALNLWHQYSDADGELVVSDAYEIDL